LITRHIFKILLLSLAFVPSGLAPFTSTLSLTLMFVFGYWRLSVLVLSVLAVAAFPSTYNLLVEEGTGLQVAFTAISGFILPSNVCLDTADPDPLMYHDPLIPGYVWDMIYVSENMGRVSLNLPPMVGFAFLLVNPVYVWMPAALINAALIPAGLLIGAVIHRGKLAKRVRARVPQYLLSRS